ncbi:MAG: ATP-dependent helicase HrpB [Bacteroidetes bacterium]|nr:ATP-dependent helicase HrpB [Bacteroidota bacterium]
MTDLPIEEVLPQLREALRARNCAVLEAPPGAGKTTRVPLALLDEPWLEGRGIVMLEPRRIAARAAAARMAWLLGERVGERVGYRIRMETNTSRATRVEVVTEGILARMLSGDPALEKVGLVIFDEFHERSLHADLGLALALDAQRHLRSDLRILVMSATLDGGRIASLLGAAADVPAPVVTSAGRMFPVRTHYHERDREQWVEQAVAAMVARSLRRGEGDLLVFLPGAGEIRRTAALLEGSTLPQGTRVMQLHGMLTSEEQDAAIAPSPSGTTKVVLATSIAETSITLDGVRAVIDSGLARVPRFSPRSGMTRLETIRVTRASADQRCGRAGRQGPGVCHRLWSAAEQESLLAFNTPEILEADLASLALELAEWGVGDPASLAWLDLPPVAAFAQARELLAELAALDAAGTITRHGRRMAALALHPRLAHMLLAAMELGLGSLATRLAALVGERDIFKAANGTVDVDLRLRLETLLAIERRVRPDAPHAHGYHLDRAACHRIIAQAHQWRSRLGIRDEGNDPESCGMLLALAYPDRIAQARPGMPGRYLLRNGGAAVMAETQTLAASAYVVVADLDGQRRESRIFSAAPISQDEIEMEFADWIVSREVIAWDEVTGAVRARRLDRLGAITLREAQIASPNPESIAEALVQAIEAAGIGMLPWSREARRTQQRMMFMHGADATWPDVSDALLQASLREWLIPHLGGMRRREELARLDLAAILLGMLSWSQRAALEENAPTHLEVPSGSRIPIDYSTPEAPTLSVRLQEMFGLAETPRIGGGRIPLTIHLLSPANRPVQVTRDLENFWRSTYFDVRKDLKGRYPKHHWPDDPMQATPTSRAKPRR